MEEFQYYYGTRSKTKSKYLADFTVVEMCPPLLVVGREEDCREQPAIKSTSAIFKKKGMIFDTFAIPQIV